MVRETRRNTRRMNAVEHTATSEGQALESARRTFDIEAAALGALRARLDGAFAAACRICLGCRGRVIVTGMGKSGHVARKIAATLASTGTPAFFLHPGEASHGDIGMITRGDVLLALSNSGETPELLALLPPLKRLATPLIALTGNAASTLALAADVHLDVGVPQEACPHNLAPTASTTAALVMGDALAVALLEARGFSADDFARTHPGGTLGRRLLLHVEDIMRRGDALPRVGVDTLVAEGLLEMTGKGLGMTAVLDKEQRVVGIFTDGDLRRALDRRVDVHNATMQQVMTPGGRSIGARELAAAAAAQMELHRVTALLVTDSERRLIGALNVHDLLRAGVV
jgi:arabinose-5-phosphate isomerase